MKICVVFHLILAKKIQSYQASWLEYVAKWADAISTRISKDTRLRKTKKMECVFHKVSYYEN